MLIKSHTYRRHEVGFIRGELDDCIRRAFGCFYFDMHRAIDDRLTQLNMQIFDIFYKEIRDQLDP